MTTSPSHPVTQSPNQPPTNPYVGPRTFSAAQRHLFFGREREARDLLARVLSERLLLFYAQSGAGKSSLLHARLIPLLQEEKGFVVLPVGRVSGELPAGVAQVDNIFVYNLLLSVDEGSEPGQLAQVSLGDFLARLARRSVVDADGQERKGWVYDSELAPAPAGAAPGARRYALIVDQFEEIITSHPARWREREDFFRQVDAALAADPSLWMVLTLREDYVAALDPYAELCFNRLRARFYMERMDGAAALEAIRRPAELGGRPFAAGVAEQLVDNLRQVRVPGQETTVAGQYVEPVQLQVVCFQLWENLERETRRTEETESVGPPDPSNPPNLSHPSTQPAPQITFPDLAAAGNVDQALTAFYEETVAAALADPAAAGVSERQVRAWFDEQLITEAGTRGLVHQGERESGGLPNGVVRALQRRFLVRGEARGGDVWIELVHDRFVEPIRASNAAWFPQHLSALQRQAELWHEQGRSSGLLLRDAALAEAEAWAASHPEEVGNDERQFLEACRQTRQAVERERRDSRRIRMLASATTIVAMMALIVAVFAVRAQSIAKARQLAADAISLLSSDPELSVLLAAESARVSRTAQTEEALRKSLLQSHVYATLSTNDPSSFFGSQARPKEALFSPDSRYILSMFDWAEAIWNIDTRGLVAKMDHTIYRETPSGSSQSFGGNNVAAFSSTGRYIVTSGARGCATEIWETESGRRIAAFEPVAEVNGAAFSHSEDFVVTAEGSSPFSSGTSWGAARVWSISTGEVISQLHESSNAPIENASFSPNDRLILTTAYSTARVWDWKRGEALSDFDYDDGSFPPVFSPDGQWILTTADNLVARTLDPTSGETVANFNHGDTMSSAQFSPDGLYVITSGSSAAHVWRAATGDVVSTIRGLGSALRVIGFSPDSKYVLAIEGKLAHVWEAQTGKLVSSLAGHSDQINGAAFSHNGQFVVTAGRDSVARVWAASSGALLAELRGHTSGVLDVAFSGDDKWILTVSADKTVRVWDSGTINFVPELRDHTGGIHGLTDVAISPDGGYAITVNDEDARTWELSTGRAVSSLQGNVSVSSAEFSPDGRLAALQGQGRSDRTSQVVEAKTGRDVAALGGVIYYVDDAALSSDGRLASIAGRAWPNGSGNVIYTWDLNTGTRLTRTLPSEAVHGDLGGLGVGNIVPDGRFVSGSSALWRLDTAERVADLTCDSCVFSSDGSAVFVWEPVPTVWNAETWQKLAELGGHSSWVHTARFSSDAALLVTAARDDRIALVWDTSSGEQLVALSHPSDVNDASFSPDDSLVVTASDDSSARVWNTSTGDLVVELVASQGPLVSTEFSANGDYIAIASSDGPVEIWATAAWTRTLSVIGSSPVFSPDSNTLITWSDWSAMLWDTRTGKLLFTWEGFDDWDFLRSEELNLRPKFSSDSKFVAIATRDLSDRSAIEFRVWNLVTGRELTPSEAVIIAVDMINTRALLLNPGGETQLWNFGSDDLGIVLGGEALQPTFSHDSQMVATVGGNVAQLWSASTGQPLQTLRGHTSVVNSVQFAPDGRYLVTASNDQTARTWDSLTGRTLHELTGHTAPVTNAMFSPDGQTIFTVSDDGTIRVWHAHSGGQTQVIEYADPHATPASPITFSDDLGVVPNRPRAISALSPDGKYLVTLDGSSLSIWDVNSGKIVTTVAIDSWVMPRFSPDSRWLVVADVMTAAVIEAASGHMIARLSGHTGDVLDVEFARNGRYIITTSTDGTARIFPLVQFLPYEDLVELTSIRSTRRLTCAERRVHVNSNDACTAELAAEARLEEGRDLARNGDATGATAKFREALAFDETIPIEPEAEARRIAIDVLISEGELLARRGEIADAVAKYNRALQLDPALRIDPMGTARGHALRAAIERLVENRQGDLQDDLQSALVLADPPPDLPADMWNALCWFGALYGHADQVVNGACEEAVSLMDAADFLDSRGLARALTGDVQGAIADFEAALAKGLLEYERRQWVERLRNGEDSRIVFDTETLQRLR